MFAKETGWKISGLSILLGFCLGLWVFPIPACAQIGNASLGGTVMDPSGGVVADAELTLTSKATGFEAKATSNERGEYTFRNLTPGTYDLRITKSGFQNYVQTGIVVTINQSARADATLKVGAAAETITVEGENTLINYDNGTLQGGADPETIKNLPLVIEGKPRSSAALAVLLPGVSTGGGNQAFQARINGGQESGDEALLDGATMQEGFMNQSGMTAIQQDFQMSPDMVQEVKVLTSSYDAQYGSSTSGQITMVSKGGTSQYHAAAFEYARNAALNAAQWGAPHRSPDNEHNFGANVGGPIKIPWLYHGTSKHHSFFYFNWESYHQAGGSNSPTLSIPSSLERTGDFSDWGSPIFVPGNAFAAPGVNGGLSTGCQAALNSEGVTTGGVQFPNNKIPQACISTVATGYLAALPTPTNTQAINNYRLPKPVPDTLTSNSNVFMTRIDHNYGDKDHFYFFWWRQFTGWNTATALPVSISTESPTRPQNSPIARFNWEHTFSGTLTNHATFGYLNRNEGYGSENLAFINKPLLQVQILGAPTPNALPAFTFSDGFTQISNSNGPPNTNITARPTWVFNDMVNKVHGHHTFTFGGEWRSVQGNIHQSNNQSGTFNFDRSTTSLSGTGGSPVAGFLLGAASGASVDRRIVGAWYPRQTVFALHANDSWKITTKLTLNYGLRWDYYTPSREKYDHFSFADLVGKNPAGIAGRLAFAGNNSVCQSAATGDACFGAPYPEQPWKKGFAPRLGVAYAWDQKTVVRAGYGIFFGQAFYPGWGGGMSLDGFNLHQALGTSPNGASVNPALYLDNGVPAPAQPPPFIDSRFDNGQSPLYRTVDGNKRPYSSQWNLTIERQLPYEVFLSLAYVGNKGTRLQSSLNAVNVLDPFSPAIQALEAPITPVPAACFTTHSNTLDCSYTPELNAKFTSDSQTLYGVKAPYVGWVNDLTSKGNCAPTVAQALLPFPQFCGVLQGLNENHGSSIYHSFQLKAEKRYSKGLYMLVAYTNSKLLSNASDNTQQAGGSWNATQGIISPYEERRARSLSSDDVPQILSAAFVYDLPVGRGQKYLNQSGGLHALVGGWQLSPILHLQSGTPMWVRSSNCQVVGQFDQGCLVGLVPGVNPFLQDPNSYDPSKGPLLSSAAFESSNAFCVAGTAPAGSTLPSTCTGAYGYTGIGPRISNLRGPHGKNLDFSLTKNTRIGERMNFQLRFAFFNALNQHYFYPAASVNNQGSNFAFNNDVNKVSFGSWNGGVSSPRTIQIGARIEF
jgi:hypothetical protein